MKFQHLFKIHLISSNLQNILESSSETCMLNLSLFREVNLFQGKMLTVPALWNIIKFQFFQSSPAFIKLSKFFGIIIRNMHVKCEPIQRSQLISRKNADCAGPLKYHEISTFFQSSPTFFKLAEHIGIIIRNMHVKFEPIQRS